MKITFIALLAFAMTACTTSEKKCDTTCETSTGSVVESVEVSSDIAYINVEYVLSQSDIYKNEGVALQRKTERAQSSWAQKEQDLQNDAAKLQDRYQRGLITTANAQAEQEKIQQRAASFQTSTQNEMRSLEEENTVFSNRTRNLIQRAVSEINADRKYKFILDASALIDADTTFNISPRIIEVVNRLYAADQASEKK